MKIITSIIFWGLSSTAFAQVILQSNPELVEQEIRIINGDSVVPAEVIKNNHASTNQGTPLIDVESLPTELSNSQTLGFPISMASLTSQCNPVEKGNEAAFKNLMLDFEGFLIPIETKASWMPIDPGNAADDTITGIDSDNDCVRDDIERYIGKIFKSKNQQHQRKYLYEYAKWLGVFIKISHWSIDTSKEIATQQYRAAECVRRIHGYTVETRQILDDIFAQFHNTKMRSLRYIRNDAKIGGWVSRESISVSCP